MSEKKRLTSKIKAVLFDVDNTLMDFMKMKNRAVENAVDAMLDAGLPLSHDETLTRINKLYEEFGIEYQYVFDELLNEVLGEIDNKILAAGVVAYRRIKEGYVEPYPHTISTLIELMKRGYILGVISDAPRFQVWSRLVGMNIHHYFNFVIALEDTGVRKPEELPFKVAIDKLGLTPEEILMIGDDPRRDIAGANRLGMITVLARYGCEFQIDPNKDDQQPDFEIDDIKKLLQLL